MLLKLLFLSQNFYFIFFSYEKWSKIFWNLLHKNFMTINKKIIKYKILYENWNKLRLKLFLAQNLNK
jgi:hypothetical protein